MLLIEQSFEVIEQIGRRLFVVHYADHRSLLLQKDLGNNQTLSGANKTRNARDPLIFGQALPQFLPRQRLFK